MSENNPFQAPKSDITLDNKTGSKRMATRVERFLASFVDSLIAIAVIAPFMYQLGYFDYIQTGEPPSFLMLAQSTVFAFIAYMAIHYYFIQKNGQTIGKKLLKIRIENRDGSVASFNTIIFKRHLFVTAISLIPMIGSLLAIIDVLFIFRKNHYCLHDDVASTQVTKCD